MDFQDLLNNNIGKQTTLKILEVKIILNTLKRSFKEIEKHDPGYDLNYCIGYMITVLKKNKINHSVTGKFLITTFNEILKQNKKNKKFNIVKFLTEKIKVLDNENKKKSDTKEQKTKENESNDNDINIEYTDDEEEPDEDEESEDSFIVDDDDEDLDNSDFDDEDDEEYTSDDELIDGYMFGTDSEPTDNIIEFIKLRYSKDNIRRDVKYFHNLDEEQQNNTVDMLSEINEINNVNKPLVFKVLESHMNIETKANVIEKIRKLGNSESGENTKILTWIENLLRVPFGINSNNEYKYGKSNQKNIKYAEGILEQCIHGHNDAKRRILQILAQNMNNPDSGGAIFGIQGPIGNGKTTLVKEGLSKILNKPFSFIALGGASDGSFLEGHSFTYEGSVWGRIVNVLMESKCMNPVIYFDELDKVSDTQKGDEIINILIHLTDPSQNSQFNDKYYQGINFDLSKATIIFSYNDYHKINPILRDRIINIKTTSLKVHEKITIAKDYLLPSIEKDVGMKNKVKISNDILEYMIDNYTNEGGVRKLKELLYEIIRELNLRKMNGDKLPTKIVKSTLTNDILKNKIPIQKSTIKSESHVGYVNGLYASDNHTGGITCIETKMIPSDTVLQLKLTGQQGDVMKESMNVALTVAWNIIPEKTRAAFKTSFKSKGNMGIHIHCPEGATPKDGPSAGLAITTAIVSLLLDIPIKNTIAMTGEIDLNGNALMIGGLEDKLYGAKQANVEKVLCPCANKKDLDLIMKKNPELKKMNVVMVNNITEVIEHSFCEKEKSIKAIMKNNN